MLTYLKGLLASSANNKNVEVVLPPSGSIAAAINEDPKVRKQNLKNRITEIKTQQKNLQKELAAAQKELTKVSSGSNNNKTGSNLKTNKKTTTTNNKTKSGSRR